MRRTILAGLIFSGMGYATLPILIAHSVERLPNGNTLMVDGGQPAVPSGRAFEVDNLGRLVWAYLKCDVLWTHTAHRLPNGNTLFAASNANRVLEVGPAGDSVWALAADLNYPNEAYRLESGNTLITDRNNSRVIEADSTGAIVWEYPALLHPHNANRLPNGNTLICDSDHNRVIEITPAGSTVWQKTGLNWPRSAQRLPGYRTLIADSRNNRVIEVDSAGAIVWDQPGTTAYQGVRLAGGNTLISTAQRVIEVAPDNQIVWQYPAVTSVLVETLRVLNPSSGCSLYVHIHRPAYARPEFPVPGVVLVPGGNGVGTSYDDNALADNLANDGFAVLHFDPDGRGLSGSYPENYAGFIHQDGLRECARWLAARDYVDAARLGIYSQSYGITMASGMIARYPQSPAVKFLLDFEGPADRNQTCRDSGGHVPVPPDSEAFWREREAARFMKQVACSYLRVQTVSDHNPGITDNRHCIQLVDSATDPTHGGAGMSFWTRVNDSTMNPANRTYTVSDPPVWIPEIQDSLQTLPRTILYLHELAQQEVVTAVRGRYRTLPDVRPPTLLSVWPNPCRGSLGLQLADDTFLLVSGPGEKTRQGKRSCTISICDIAGRTVKALSLGLSARACLDVNDLPDGVYFCRARTTETSIGTRQFLLVR
jgi:hypothetical protein